MTACILDLTDEAAARSVAADARRGARSAIVGQQALGVVAEANRRWQTEAVWRSRFVEALAAWQGHVDVSDEIPDLEALLDPALWSRKLATEWPRDTPENGLRTAALPLGVVLHVCPGNGVSTGLWTILHGVLAGNQNLVKVSRKSPPVVPLIVDLLVSCGLPESQVGFVSWPREAERICRALVEEVDGIVVWGDGPTIEFFRGQAPSGVRVIERGPRLSISVLTRGRRADREAYEGIAVDVCAHEQRSCASTQCMFVELGEEEAGSSARGEVLQALGEAFTAYAVGHPPPWKSTDVQLEMLKRLELAKLGRLRNQSDFVSAYPDWLVIWEEGGPVKPSSLFRTLYVRPFRTDTELSALLLPIRWYLQTASLACAAAEHERWVEFLWRTGVNRVVPAGRSSAVVATAPQDGRYLLPEFFRVATDERPCISGRP